MLAIKKLVHKLGGRMWIEMVLSLTPEDKKRPNRAYMQVAEDFVRVFEEYQVLYTVHLDSPIRHLHFMMNSVSIRTGKKYSQSPSDLQRLKAKTNDILQAHGFDIIRIGAEQMLDLTDHSNEVGFEYLEISEEVVTEQTVTIGHEIDIEKHEIFFTPEKDYLSGGGIPMNYEPTYPVAETSVQESESTEIMNPEKPTAICSPAVPSEVRPTLSVNMGTHYRLYQCGPVLREETVEAAQELGETSPAQLNAAANMTIALYGAARDKGFDVNIAVNAAPTIDIFLGHDVLGEKPDLTIGTNLTVIDEDED